MGKFKSGTLEALLVNLRNEMTDTLMVFNKIEGHDILPSDIPESIANKPNAKDIFCRSYIIAVVEDCADEKDFDTLLMMCGFLQGYDGLNITKRRQEYCRSIGIYDKEKGIDQTLDEHWHNDENLIKSSMYSRENIAVSQLVRKLNERTDKPDYINKAKELVNRPYPIPNYLRGPGHGYRKCEVENKVFYIPLTVEERRALANTTATMKESGKIVKDAAIADNRSFGTMDNGTNPEHTPESQKIRNPIVDFIFSDFLQALLQTIDKLAGIFLKIISIFLVILIMCFFLRNIKIFIPDIDSTNPPIAETSSALSEQVDNTEDDLSDIPNAVISKP